MSGDPLAQRDAAGWDRAATEILLSAGRVRPDAPVRGALPVSSRGEDDLRAIRERSKAAFTRTGTAEPAARSLEPLVQLLPDALVAVGADVTGAAVPVLEPRRAARAVHRPRRRARDDVVTSGP